LFPAPQPEGPSFAVEGNQVKWEGWDFHVGFSWREGLILNNLQYNDHGTLRPVLYRAALAEIIVPYGEPRGKLCCW
jgi:primary-amine oxidase